MVSSFQVEKNFGEVENSDCWKNSHPLCIVEVLLKNEPAEKRVMSRTAVRQVSFETGDNRAWKKRGTSEDPEAMQTAPPAQPEAAGDRLVHFAVGDRRWGLTAATWGIFPTSVLASTVATRGRSGQPIRAFEDEDPDAFGRVVQFLRRGGAPVVPPRDDEDLEALLCLATKLCLTALVAELRLDRQRRVWERDLERIGREQIRLRQTLDEAARLATNGNYYENGSAHPRTQQQNVQTVVVDVQTPEPPPAGAPAALNIASSTSMPHLQQGVATSLGPLVSRMTLREGYQVINVCQLPNDSPPPPPAYPHDGVIPPPPHGYTRVSPVRTTRLGVTLQKMSDVARIHGRGNELGRDTGALIARAVGALDRRFHRFLLRQLPRRFRARSAHVDSRPTAPAGSFVSAEDYRIEFDPHTYYGDDGTLDYDPDFTSLGPEIDELFDHLLDRQVFEGAAPDAQNALRRRFERAFALPPQQGTLSNDSDRPIDSYFLDQQLKNTPHLRALDSAIANTRAYFMAQRNLLAGLLTDIPPDNANDFA